MLSSVRRWLLVLAFASSAALVSAQGNVWIVGPGGFSQIQDAVDVAQDGDTILVRSQNTSILQSVTIDGKALTIAGDLPSELATASGVQVLNLPAGGTVVLSRLRFQSSWFALKPLLLQNNAGSVRVVSCDGSSQFYIPPATVTIESSSGSSAFASCNLVGGDGGYKAEGFPGGWGLDVLDSTAAVFDSTLAGGDGGYAYVLDAGEGGRGASVRVDQGGTPARLLLSNSTVQGGAGGEMKLCSGYAPGDGGHGLFVGAGSSARKEASTFGGGAAGESPSCAPDGVAGEAIVVSGSVQDDPSPALMLTAPTLAHEGETITLTFTGTPSDRVVLISGARTAFQELAPGPLLVHQRGRFPLRRPVGVIGPSGVLSVPYPLPMLPSGVGAQNLFFQGLATHASGGRTLGSFAVVTVLDSAL